MMFLNVHNRFIGNREQVLKDCELMRNVIVDFTELDKKIEKQNDEIEMVAERVREL